MDNKKNNTNCDEKDEICIEENIQITMRCERGQKLPLITTQCLLYSANIKTSDQYNSTK